jgi:hypothetical protein
MTAGSGGDSPIDIVELARRNDAFRRVIVTGDHTSPIAPNQLVFVRAGTRHNFRASAGRPLRLVTVYAPPEHPPGTVHQTRQEADAAEVH